MSTTEKRGLRKRRRGEGTVFKRNGMWTAEASLGRKPDGSRLRVTVYAKTISELNEKLTKAKREAWTASPKVKKTITVADLADEWFEATKGAVSPGTATNYDEHIRLHVKPHIGGSKLTQLDTAHIGVFVKRLSKGEDALSPSLVRKVFRTLRAAISYAVDHEYLAKDPALPVRKSLPKHVKATKSSLTPEQVGWLMAAVTGNRLEGLIHVAIDSGCRMGELLALDWSDYDAATGILSVTKSLALIRGKPILKETKTKRGVRSVVLSFARPALDLHRERMKAEGRDVKNGLVFCDNLGGYLRKSNVDRRFFEPAAKRAGLPNLTFHGLRHSSASLMIAAGADIPTVSKRLGHASAAFTLSVYAHAVEGLQATAADQLKTILTGTQKPTA